MAILQSRNRTSPLSLFCAGKVHLDRQSIALLDLRARVGPTRVGLVEDGAMFCVSCAHELNRGGGEPR